MVLGFVGGGLTLWIRDVRLKNVSGVVCSVLNMYTAKTCRKKFTKSSSCNWWGLDIVDGEGGIGILSGIDCRGSGIGQDIVD